MSARKANRTKLQLRLTRDQRAALVEARENMVGGSYGKVIDRYVLEGLSPMAVTATTGGSKYVNSNFTVADTTLEILVRKAGRNGSLNELIRSLLFQDAPLVMKTPRSKGIVFYPDPGLDEAIDYVRANYPQYQNLSRHQTVRQIAFEAIEKMLLGIEEDDAQ